MAFYVVYVVATGEAKTFTSTAPVGLPGSLATKTYATAPDMATVLWNTASLDFVARPPRTRTKLMRREFLRRFTFAENVKLNEIRLNPVTLAIQRARLETVRDYLFNDEENNLTDTEIVSAVDEYLTALRDAGFYTTAQALARRTEILAPMVEP